MTTTSYQGQYFQRAQGPRQDARRVARLPVAQNPERQPSTGGTLLQARMQWIAVASLLGFVASYLLGAAISAFDLRHLTLPTTQNVAASTSAAIEAEPHYPTFHEPFNLHPTQGDVEEPPVTF